MEKNTKINSEFNRSPFFYVGDKFKLLSQLREDANKIDTKSLYICCLIFGVVAIFMTFVNLISKETEMAFITSGIAMWIAISIIGYKILKKKEWLIVSILVCAYIVMMYFWEKEKSENENL